VRNHFFEQSISKSYKRILMKFFVEVRIGLQAGAVLSQKFWGGGIAPISLFVTKSIFSVL